MSEADSDGTDVRRAVVLDYLAHGLSDDGRPQYEKAPAGYALSVDDFQLYQVAFDEDRELRYELARAIEHVNRFTVLEPEEAQQLVDDLQEIEKVDEATAYKIANLLPRNRPELRSVYAQQRYSLSGEELDEILNVIAKYA